jgi:3',5'-cyclic AMP phosphodiesterase CpdA
MRAALLAALASSVLAAPDALFEQGAPAALPPAPPAPAARPVEAARKPTPVPPDLAAAAPRVGNAAMIARLPARAPGGRFVFGVIGDAERGRFWWERVFSPEKKAFVAQWRSLQAGPADFVLQLGDFVSEGDPESYREHLAVLDAELRKPLLRCVGNHDRSRPNGDADKNLYDAVFGARDYHFEHAGWRFVSLDTSDRVVRPAQLAWLRAVLAVPGPKVVFTHVPPAYLRKAPPLKEVGDLEAWPKDAHEAEEKRRYLEDFFTNYFEEGAAEFEDLMTSSGVKAVYMGHIHAFWAADWKGVRYVISGGGGSPLYPLPPGYPKKRFAHTLRVEAGPSGLSETVVPYGGGAPFVLPPVRP